MEDLSNIIDDDDMFFLFFFHIMIVVFVWMLVRALWNFHYVDDDKMQIASAEDAAISQIEIAQIEKIIQYRFRNPQLLRDAVVHSSYDPQSSSEKLAFIGDSVLGLLLTQHLYVTYPELQRGALTLLRSRNVDKEKFARAAVKNGLHRFIRLKDRNLQGLINDFVEAMEAQDKSYRDGDVKPLRLLSETIESIAGAVLVDGGYSIDNVWKVMRPLLEPIIGSDSLELHPVSELQEFCQGRGLATKYETYTIDSETELIRAEVLVEPQIIGFADHQIKDLALRTAAKTALDTLKKTPEMPLDNKEGKDHLEGQQLLHTYCQKKHWPNPEYRKIKDEGLSHQKKYIYSVRLKINNCCTNEFYSKPMPRINEAKNLAAKELLNFLQENENPT